MNGIVVAIIAGVVVVGALVGYLIYSNLSGGDSSSSSSASKQDFSSLDESASSTGGETGEPNVQSSVPDAGGGGEEIEKDISSDEQVPARAPDEVWVVHRKPGGRRDKAYHVEDFPARVGRHPYSAVQLSGRDISRIHFRIHRDGIGFEIQPLKTKNPTVLNEDQPLAANQGHSVTDSDIIEIGETRLEFKLEEPDIRGAAEETDEEEKRRGEKYTAKPALAGGDDWRKKLHRALKKHNGQLERVAEELEMSQNALRQMVEQMGMERLVKN
jgi:pSer/pThr/pTyr-binding forkhead associated (FHA) protein